MRRFAEDGRLSMHLSSGGLLPGGRKLRPTVDVCVTAGFESVGLARRIFVGGDLCGCFCRRRTACQRNTEQ